MKRIAAVVLALTVAMATPGMAQKHKGKEKGRDHDRERYRGNGAVIHATRAAVKNGAPSFCRSGAGHPRFGRSWCVQKGFGLGASRWDRVVWNDAVFRSRRATVRDVLSSVILGRLATYAAQQLGYSAPLAGTWLIDSPDRRVYLVRSASAPVAEFVDTNYDGRADFVLLYNR